MAAGLSATGNIWQAVDNHQYRANDWKYRYLRAVWHGEMQLITDLDRVFDHREKANIDMIRTEVNTYEKQIEERGTSAVNHERTQKEKTSKKVK